jgi:hypothetical protein
MESEYTKAYQDGKLALGTIQYADANAGLRALTVPGSAASTFSGWKKTWSANEPGIYKLVVQGYDAVSNCYSKVGISEPASLANGRDDMAQLNSDIGRWIPDATGWQIQETSNAKSSSDEAAIAADIASVQQDISDLKDEQITK